MVSTRGEGINFLFYQCFLLFESFFYSLKFCVLFHASRINFWAAISSFWSTVDSSVM